MINRTDFSGLLMILAGPLSGVVAAHQHNGGVSSLILFGAIGFAVGLLVAMASSECSYRILGSKRVPAGLQFTSCMLVPMISLLLVILFPSFLATMVYGRA
jgi:hypothetical protein